MGKGKYVCVLPHSTLRIPQLKGVPGHQSEASASKVQRSTERRHPADPGRTGKVGMADVLVVEDDDGVRKILRRALQAEGHTVLVAGNAEEGLRLARKECPDVVITDLNLPGMKGDELIRRLGQAPDRPMIIAMTGVRTALVLVKGEVDRTLSKPIDPDELNLALRELLGD